MSVTQFVPIGMTGVGSRLLGWALGWCPVTLLYHQGISVPGKEHAKSYWSAGDKSTRRRRERGRTMRRMGLSSSMSMGTLVLWIQVLVQRWRSLT